MLSRDGLFCKTFVHLHYSSIKKLFLIVFHAAIGSMRQPPRTECFAMALHRYDLCSYNSGHPSGMAALPLAAMLAWLLHEPAMERMEFFFQPPAAAAHHQTALRTGTCLLRRRLCAMLKGLKWSLSGILKHFLSFEKANCPVFGIFKGFQGVLCGTLRHF